MNVSRSSLLRYLTPGIVVALVLGYSFVIPATANDDKSGQCGYGYSNGHTDNESEQGEDNESEQAENNDEPCGEVSGDEDTAETGDTSEKADKPETSKTHTVSTAAQSHSDAGEKSDSENKKGSGGGDD